MAELKEQADGDALSGLRNRCGFEGAAGAAVCACTDDDRPAALPRSASVSPPRRRARGCRS